MGHLRRVTVAVALLIVLLLTGCEPSVRPPLIVEPTPTATNANDGATRGTLSFAIQEPAGITPGEVWTGDELIVVDTLFDSLTRWDAAGDPQPSAAVSWESSDNETRWTFQLRPGAQFHDGSPVTSADFERGWQQAALHGGFSHLLADIVGYSAFVDGTATELAGLDATDPAVLVVQLQHPRADFGVIVGHPSLGPISRPEPIPDSGDELAAPSGDVPVGNGPFKLVEPWSRGSFIRVESWDQWINGTRPDTAIREVVFRSGEPDLNYLAFTQGRRDVAAVPSGALELARAAYPPRGGIWDGPGLILGARPVGYLLAINPAVSPYDDETVRRAVSLSLDRRAISEQIQGGNTAPSTSLLPPAVPGWRSGTCDSCTYNPLGAAELFDAAEVRQLTYWFNAGGGHELIRNVLRGGLSDAGVSLVSNGRRSAPTLPEYQQIIAEGRAGMFRLPLVADVPSALATIYPLAHGQRIDRGLNPTAYNDPTVNALLDQAATVENRRVREQLVRRVEDILINRDRVLLPVVTYQHAVVISDRVSGLTYSPWGPLALETVSVS